MFNKNWFILALIAGLSACDDSDSASSSLTNVIPDASATAPEGTVIPTSETGIDLQDWYLSIPIDTDNSGTSDSIKEDELADDYSHSDFFYGIEETNGDTGIVMMSPPRGYKTSENTNYVRVELREMLRRGDTSISTQGVNKNNWIFSSNINQQDDAGGVDGELNVTLAINNVTTGGDSYQVGRVVIGQIHANDDEPIRLYYQKDPDDDKGRVYFYHEPLTDSDNEVFKSLVTVDDGIALNEKFSYRIKVVGNLLSVWIYDEDGVELGFNDYDMSSSGFDADDQYMYFKVGLYHLNNTAPDGQYVQGTFYEIKNAHDGYSYSEY